eukprot:6440427-Pyramimonas_sp.AAC.1
MPTLAPGRRQGRAHVEHEMRNRALDVCDDGPPILPVDVLLLQGSLHLLDVGRVRIGELALGR